MSEIKPLYGVWITTKTTTMIYLTDKKAKIKIDTLLKQNARNVANFKTRSIYDLKTKKAFDKAWRDIERDIKDIDPLFYKIISRQDD